MLRSGLIPEVTRASGEWAFVDIGFAREGRTSGLLVEDGEPKLLTFSELRAAITTLVSESGRPLNLVIEAPLSAAFTKLGNPAGRAIEKSDASHRYWYAGLGCQVTIAAAYVLRAVLETPIAREIRLFEAFVTFKSAGIRSSHAADVRAMRSVVWGDADAVGRIIAPDQLRGPNAESIESAFKVFGFDLGVPPVIVASAV
jgi:hypothetical protein